MDCSRFNVSCDYCDNKQKASFILGKRCVPCCNDCIDLVNNPRISTTDERKTVYKEIKSLIKYSLGLSTPPYSLSASGKEYGVCIGASELCKDADVVIPQTVHNNNPFIIYNNTLLSREENIIFKLNFTQEVGADLSYTAVSNGMSFSFKKKMNIMLEKRLYNIRVQYIITNSRNEYY